MDQAGRVFKCGVIFFRGLWVNFTCLYDQNNVREKMKEKKELIFTFEISSSRAFRSVQKHDGAFLNVCMR